MPKHDAAVAIDHQKSRYVRDAVFFRPSAIFIEVRGIVHFFFPRSFDGTLAFGFDVRWIEIHNSQGPQTASLEASVQRHHGRHGRSTSASGGVPCFHEQHVFAARIGERQRSSIHPRFGIQAGEVFHGCGFSDCGARRTAVPRFVAAQRKHCSKSDDGWFDDAWMRHDDAYVPCFGAGDER